MITGCIKKVVHLWYVILHYILREVWPYQFIIYFYRTNCIKAKVSSSIYTSFDLSFFKIFLLLYFSAFTFPASAASRVLILGFMNLCSKGLYEHYKSCPPNFWTIIEFRCRKSKTTTQETDRNSIATTTTLEDGLTNVALDDDGLVSATKLRTPEVKQETEGSQGLDPKFEEMLDNAYADARQFAKFPHMP